eukprot:GEMP01037945.1.p1 GENE.GEMP01037945.1~~GEMP01037945.1.p1  ORF type:complete len:535 (+),score=118.97 GEMP01037945.1:13-1617(+)
MWALATLSALVRGIDLPDFRDAVDSVRLPLESAAEILDCTDREDFAALKASLNGLAKLRLDKGDPVKIAFKIFSDYEANPLLFQECPAGVLTAIVYLSVAQEKAEKYSLLHKATFLLFSTPDIPWGSWPINDVLIKTLYANTEKLKPLMSAQLPRTLVIESNLKEALNRNWIFANKKIVHFKSVVFFNLYEPLENHPCSCRTRSWCLPFWMRALTNSSTDIYLVGRDEAKTVYRMDATGCLRSLENGLATHRLEYEFDLQFVFEINAFMQGESRGNIKARHTILYPTFSLTPAQMDNFKHYGVSILPDDEILKPPNPYFAKALKLARDPGPLLHPRMLLFPADLRPSKGQKDFLLGLLKFPGRVEGVRVVLAGACDGNSTYCDEVVTICQSMKGGAVECDIADIVPDEQLAYLYGAALGVVSYSSVDCNPRAIFEGLYTNTPFFATFDSRLPSVVQYLGYVVEFGSDALGDEVASFVDDCERNVWGTLQQEFADEYLAENVAYGRIVDEMDRAFLSRKPEPELMKDNAFTSLLR